MDAKLERLHRELMDITEKTLRISEAEGAECYLGWGSCLGALRHGGIIPWDDDVDLLLSYRDYFKLKAAFQGNEKYFWQDIESDPEYYNSWAKIRKNGTCSMEIAKMGLDINWGVCIDLFPLMEYDRPRLRKSTRLKILLAEVLSRLPHTKRFGSRGIQKLLKAFYALIGEKGRKFLFFRLLSSIERKGDYLLDFSDKTQDFILKKSDFRPGRPVDFGGIKARVPENYELYLSRAYGEDWREIPPEGSEKRWVHPQAIVDCERDYREYKREMKN